MSDVTRRISRWKAKYSPEIAAQTTARIFADMTERYEASMLALNSMELDTKQVLSASGIDTMYIVFYLDFARQLFRLPSLARPDNLGPDPCARSPGALGEVGNPRRGHIRDAFLASLRGRVPFCKSLRQSATRSSASRHPRPSSRPTAHGVSPDDERRAFCPARPLTCVLYRSDTHPRLFVPPRLGRQPSARHERNLPG